MVEYAGWNMPVQYAGIAEETAAVRNDSGIFDVSHMGEIVVKGKDAARFLDWLVTRVVSGKKPDQITYCLLANAAGGTVDDLLTYQVGPDAYFLVVNAANKDKDFAHMQNSLDIYKGKVGDVDVTIEDVSADYGQIAWQGPKVRELAVTVLPQLGFAAADVEAILGLKRFRHHQIKDAKGRVDWIVSRTGYTGEDGFEFYVPLDETVGLWEKLIAANITPAGLGARDVLRLEAGLPLYGHELGEDISALDAGLGRFVELDRDFQGQAMATNQKTKVIALISQSKAIPREHYRFFAAGEPAGVVASGTFSPTLGKGIATVFVDKDFVVEGKELALEIRNKLQPFTLTESPFVK